MPFDCRPHRLFKYNYTLGANMRLHEGNSIKIPICRLETLGAKEVL